MRRLALLAIGGLLALPAFGQVLRCTDASGKVHYIDATQAGQMKCEPVRDETQTIRPQSGTLGAPSGRPPTGAGSGQQQQRISERQVQDAEAKLAEARRKLAEQEAVRNGNEKNYARVLERLEPFQREVDEAEKALEQARQSRK
jgi:hypothetical protein